MDIFYRAPSQLKQQCDSLQSNYINCLLQKSIRDNILWFHLQCPRRIQRYQDESYIRRKLRGVYNYHKQGLQRELLRVREIQKNEFQSSIYPNDIQYNPDLEPSDRVDPFKAARHKALFAKKIQIQDEEEIEKNAENLSDEEYNKHFWIPRNFNEDQ